jgi:hypothetical protein
LLRKSSDRVSMREVNAAMRVSARSLKVGNGELTVGSPWHHRDPTDEEPP